MDERSFLQTEAETSNLRSLEHTNVKAALENEKQICRKSTQLRMHTPGMLIHLCHSPAMGLESCNYTLRTLRLDDD